MAELTPRLIATEERRTAEHYDDLAAKARKTGDIEGASNFEKLATMAREQAEKVESPAPGIRKAG